MPTQNADNLAKKTLQKHGKSFNFASYFLSPEQALAAARLYSFCRTVDDTADNATDAAQKKRAYEELSTVKSHIHANSSNIEWVTDFLELCRDYNINQSLGATLIDGVLSDTGQVQIQDVPQLIQYAYRVAGVVGEMMCPILGAKPGAEPFAIDLGIGMQLTNIARDVLEDAHQDRQYIPGEWIPKSSPQTIRSASSTSRQNIQLAIEKLLQLSEDYYKSGFLGLAYLPRKSSLAIRIAGSVYREIGILIQKKNYAYWEGRVRTSFLRKLRIAFFAAFKRRKSSLAKHNSTLHVHLKGTANVH